MNRQPRFQHAAAAALALLLAGRVGAQPAPAGAPPPPPVVSPEIAANGDVTLRLRAPQAGKVEVVSGGDVPAIPIQGGLPLTKGADGVWRVSFRSSPPARTAIVSMSTACPRPIP